MTGTPTAPTPAKRHWPLTGRQTGAVVLLVLAGAFIVQNTEDATLNIFNVDVTGPLWIVLAVLFLLGVGVGMMLRGRRDRS